MNIKDIKVGGFYFQENIDQVEYVTEIVDSKIRYETYSTRFRDKHSFMCSSRDYTRLTRPISPAEIFLRYGNDLGIVEWVKNRSKEV